ncbi:MAG TPA: MBL fold metallo-hydrolase [Thermoanaerobaculia bacterium]|nr:MBL fold metallo-hydrolase [Thermoanaerobaculia bacterium]
MTKATCIQLAAGLALMAVPALAQQDFSKVEMKVVPVSGNIYMLEGAGGNIGVSAGPDGILIVDDQYAPLAEKIKTALKGINPGQLKFVLNTHYHGDHTGGNPTFGPEAPIIAQENVRKRLESGTMVRGEKVEAMTAAGLPVITFEEAVSVHFNGEEIKAIHYPHGHTDGDSIIFFTKSNVIHMGDDFFVGRFPFVDLDNGGSVQGLTDNVAKVIAKVPAGAKIIPGHGKVSTLDDLKKYHSMLVETTGIVQKQMDAGKTLEQIQAQGLPEAWKEWGGGFIKTDFWLATLHESLQAGKKNPAGSTHH